MAKKTKFKVGDRVILKGVLQYDHGGYFSILFDGGTFPTELDANDCSKMEHYTPPVTFTPAQIAYIDELQVATKQKVVTAMRKREEK